MQGLGYIEYDTAFSDAEKKTSKALKASMHGNKAAAALKLRDWNAAIKAATKVLELEPVNVKALFRRAQAYRETEDYDLAETDLKRAMEYEPANRWVLSPLVSWSCAAPPAFRICNWGHGSLCGRVLPVP